MGGEITACFLQGHQGECARKVLQHVEFKSVVTEFVDRLNTGIGHSLSRMLWREVLASISNVRGVGVILAHDAQDMMEQALEGRDYLEYLETDYHQAALRIAASQNVQMSVWGLLLENQDRVFAQPFLTLLPAEADSWTEIRMAAPGLEEAALTARLPHVRLNFNMVETSREALFSRRFATRCAKRAGCPGGAPLRAGPGNNHPVVARLPLGQSVMGVDMTEQWLKVKPSEGPEAYLNIYHFWVTPRRIHTRSRTGVNVRRSPGRTAGALFKADLSGAYDVLDVAVVNETTRETWYRIRAGDGEGWVAGFLFEPLYVFPMVHFVEGAYRYARNDFRGATVAFERFIARGGDESNVTLAAAHQFAAAAYLGAPRAELRHAIRAALAHLDHAVDLTPFDPSAYVLRSLVKFGSNVQEPAVAAILDLRKAIELDVSDRTARDYARDLANLHNKGYMRAFNRGRELPQRDVSFLEAVIRN